MKTELKQVDTYQEVAVCSRCNKGTLNREGSLILSGNGLTLFPHECDNCGHKMVLDTEYPKVVYKMK